MISPQQPPEPAPGSSERQVPQVTSVSAFPSRWALHGATNIRAFHVDVPELTLQALGVPDGSVPEFVRPDVRQSGRATGKLRARPVLKTALAPGASYQWLAVPASLGSPGDNQVDVGVEEASLTAFRRYRLSRSVAGLASSAAAVAGTILAALGAIWLSQGIGKGLLIAGAVLTIAAAATPVIAAWRAPVE